MKDRRFSGSSKRYNSMADYFRIKYGGRIQKLAIDAGFTCPNRDGSKGEGGCTYCDNNAFNPSYCTPEKSVSQQISEGIDFHRTRYRRAIGYLAYFQAYSNTYAPLEKLKALFSEALSHPEILGLAIGTRPDCMNDQILEYLSKLSRENYLIVEYGIETCHNKTLKIINRGHDFEITAEMIKKSSSLKIRTGGHLIIGLPGETKADILESIRIVSGLPLNTIKFHQLQLIRGTKMAGDYMKNPGSIRLFELDEYLEFITEIICVLNPDFIVERIAGEVSPEYNLFPSWGLRYDQILVKFEKMLEENDLWQGKFYQG